MAAGNVFDTSVTYKAYAQVLESAANDNIISRIGIRIVSQDGSTVRATIKAVADYSSGAEWSTSLRNKAFLDGDAGAGSYTTVDGDRLVVEWGHADSSGASISASSRWGSTDAAISDLPENETDTTTTKRPWFECSLDITFKAPTQTDRYINTASTSGGDGTTNGTSGATRAWESIASAFTGLSGRDLATNNEFVVVHCSGTAADAPTSTTGVGIQIHTASDCYLMIQGDAPNALQYDTSKYRIEPAKGSAPLLNQGILFLRISQMQAKANGPDGSGGYNAFNMAAVATLEKGDCRIDRMYLDNVINDANTGGTTGYAASTAAPNVKLTITNSIAANFTGTGATHKGFLKSTGGTVDTAWYNCAAYNCGIGFHSQTNDVVAKNCGAASCADGYSGTFGSGTTNCASDLASDATGTNARNSVTPSFTSAGSDFHLQSGDTAWKDQGADLSGDSRLPFSTDGDGDTRSGTWDIGPDEYISTGPTGTFAKSLPMLTISGAGTVAINGTSSPSLPMLTPSATGTVAINGTGSPSAPMLTLSSAGAVANNGNASLTIPMLTPSATGVAPESGTAAFTIPMLTVSASGVAPINGTGSPSVPMLTLSATGAVFVNGTGSDTIPMLTIDATAVRERTGDVAVTAPMLTPSATGAVSIAGSSSVSVPMLTLSASGAVAVSASASVTLPMLTLSGSATEVVTATGTPTVPMLTLSATGAVDVVAAAADTLPMLAIDASGQVLVTGTASVAVPMLVLDATSSFQPTGDVDVTVPMMTLSAAGTVAINGTATPSLPMLTTSATGVVTIVAAAADTLPMLAISASGQVLVVGSANSTLPSYVIDASGALSGPTGTGTPVIPMLSVSATGSSTIEGDVALAVPMMTLVASSSTERTGTATVTVPMLTLASSGKVVVTGTASPSLPMVTGSATGTPEFIATGALAMPRLTIAADGTVAIVGAGSLTVPMLTTASSVLVDIVGTMTLTIPMLTSLGIATGIIFDRESIIFFSGGAKWHLASDCHGNRWDVESEGEPKWELRLRRGGAQFA